MQQWLAERKLEAIHSQLVAKEIVEVPDFDAFETEEELKTHLEGSGIRAPQVKLLWKAILSSK